MGTSHSRRSTPGRLGGYGPSGIGGSVVHRSGHGHRDLHDPAVRTQGTSPEPRQLRVRRLGRSGCVSFRRPSQTGGESATSAVRGCSVRRMADRSDDAAGGSGQFQVGILLRVSEVRFWSSSPYGATTGKDPRTRVQPRVRMQLHATRQRAPTVRRGPPRRRMRRLSKGLESCWPCGHLSSKRAGKETPPPPGTTGKVRPGRRTSMSGYRSAIQGCPRLPCPVPEGLRCGAP